MFYVDINGFIKIYYILCCYLLQKKNNILATVLLNNKNNSNSLNTIIKEKNIALDGRMIIIMNVKS